MDVVHLGQPRQRAVDRDPIRERKVGFAQAAQRLPFDRAGRSDPGAQRVGGMQPHRGARLRVGPVGRDEVAELFERTHYSVRQRLKCASALRTISFNTIAIAASTEINPNSLVGSKFWVNMVVK
jgi:hypothetical protein